MEYPNLVKALKAGKDLEEKDAKHLLRILLDENFAASQKSELLTLLTKKGESVDEIAGMANGLREMMTRVPIASDAVDTCGTGGSGLPRFNVSTISAFILAAAGVPVVKHGNKASSGRCGSFDVLEKLGVNIMLGPDQIKKTVEQFNLAFLFAPIFHPSMAVLTDVRKALGFPTVFNLLGPLANPAGAHRHVFGVSNGDSMKLIADVILRLGTKHTLIVHGSDGLDEITLTGPTDVIEVVRGDYSRKVITPEELGLKPVKDFKEISGGNTKKNAKIFMDILDRKDKGPRMDLVLANAGAGLYVGGFANSIEEGVVLAREVLKSRKPYQLFEAYKEFSQQLS